MDNRQNEILQKILRADNDLVLSEDKYDAVWALTETLCLTDSNSIVRFGTDIQKKLAEISGMMITGLRSSIADKVGETLGELSKELGDIESKNSSVSRPALDRALQRVKDTSLLLESYQIEISKELAVMDRMLEVSSEYLNELNMYIAAADILISGNTSSVKKLLVTRVSELRLTRSVSSRQIPLITKIMEDSAEITEKVQSTLYNTIPLWRDQIILALESDLAVRASRGSARLTEETNSMLRSRIDEILGIQSDDKKMLNEVDGILDKLNRNTASS